MFDSVSIGDSGFECYYQEVGEGPPVVFVHGFSGNHLAWWQQMPTFSTDYRCIAPDQRRFGRSEDPTDVGVAAFADDLVALLDDLDVERAALVGHSMGGWTVGSVATQHPERVAALVLSATPGGLISKSRHHELMAAGADSIPDVDPLTPETEFLEEAIAELNTDAPTEWEETRATLDDLPLDRDVILEADVPTYLVAGEADEFMPEPAVDAVADALEAESAILENAAHSVFYEQPAAFNRLVKGFVDDNAIF